MREIKFRGKYGNNPWIYGSLVARNRNNNGIQAQNSSAAILVDDGSCFGLIVAALCAADRR